MLPRNKYKIIDNGVEYNTTYTSNEAINHNMIDYMIEKGVHLIFIEKSMSILKVLEALMVETGVATSMGSGGLIHKIIFATRSYKDSNATVTETYNFFIGWVI